MVVWEKGIAVRMPFWDAVQQTDQSCARRVAQASLAEKDSATLGMLKVGALLGLPGLCEKWRQDLQLCWVLRRASSSEETAHLPLVAQLLYWMVL